LAFIVEMCRRGTRDRHLRPRTVRMRVPALDPGSEHAAFFGCPLQVGARYDEIVFDAEDFARPFSTHNPQMLDALLPYVQAEAAHARGSAIGRVRSVIAERLRGQRPTLGRVSKDLAMSGRALQRLLSEHGTTFRQELDQVRNQHAQGYLASTSFTDGEVGFLLGFEDPSSFYRAFRAWNGKSPNAFRRQSRSADRA
jgi:AraC-like DNA-binding protein